MQRFYNRCEDLSETSTFTPNVVLPSLQKSLQVHLTGINFHQGLTMLCFIWFHSLAHIRSVDWFFEWYQHMIQEYEHICRYEFRLSLLRIQDKLSAIKIVNFDGRTTVLATVIRLYRMIVQSNYSNFKFKRITHNYRFRNGSSLL